MTPSRSTVLSVERVLLGPCDPPRYLIMVGHTHTPPWWAFWRSESHWTAAYYGWALTYHHVVCVVALELGPMCSHDFSRWLYRQKERWEEQQRLQAALG